MKTLIIARHGKAAETKENQADMLRELTPKGQQDIEIVAMGLRRMNLIPGLILSSPAIRSVKSSRLLAAFMDIPQSVVVTRDILYGNFTTELFHDIHELCPDKEVVMIVGHNPSILLVIEYLSGLVLQHFPTSATIIVDFDVKHWSELNRTKGTVRKLFIPRELTKLCLTNPW